MQPVRIGNDEVALGQRIGQGGEGEVFIVAGRDGHVVKLYKVALRASRERKVRAMVAKALAGHTDLVSFPVEIVTDRSGLFVGFSMRLVADHRPLHQLYGPKSRKQMFPAADYRFLVHAALNVARAVATVHQTGCVIGDLNHSGVLVSGSATVALIDADSFQFGPHPCIVGVPDYTPPELHGTSLASVVRTREHDHFGLAVAIFHLLMMGRHPYSGIHEGEDVGLGEAISRNLFAFSTARRTGMRPPPGSPILADLPRQVAEGFEAAFGLDPGLRPDAASWVSMLKAMATGLNQCAKVRTHFYASAADRCTWCRIAGTGVDMFPQASVFAGAPIYVGSAGLLDVEKAAAILAAIGPGATLAVPPGWSGTITSPSAKVAQARQQQLNTRLLGALILAAAGGGAFGFPDIAIVWIGLAIFGLLKLLGATVDAEPLRCVYVQADRRAHDAAAAWLRRSGADEFKSVRTEVEEWIAEYRALDATLTREMMKLKSGREARQRAAFLDRHRIRTASIAAIGPSKTSTLASFGIETAADITKRAVMAVPGFGEALTTKLLAWRAQHETKFRYDPRPNAADVQAEADLKARSNGTRARLAADIRAGIATLQAGEARLRSQALAPDPILTKALQDRAQAEHDLLSLGLPVPPSAKVIGAALQTSSQTRAAAVVGLATTPASYSNATSHPSCPKCGSAMRRRTARRGGRAGRQFWGCSRYPDCRGTRN